MSEEENLVSYDSNADELDYLGTIQTSIVGLQYYDGHVQPYEMVILEREQNNVYDHWAIRVDNVRGQRVGHLPRTLVAHLSPLVDAGRVELEAAVHYGVHNAYKMPVFIDCYGDESDRDAIARAINRTPHRFSCRPFGQRLYCGPDAIGPRSPRAPLEPSVRAPHVRRLSATEVSQRVNTMFDSLLTEDQQRAECEPATSVQTPLYPHQKEALAWMIQQERSDSLPVFWESRSGRNGVEYLHTLTNFVSPMQPRSQRGGILADDMGLGKTLTSIALIATNKPGTAPPTVYTRVQVGAGPPKEPAEPAKGHGQDTDGRRPSKKAKTTVGWRSRAGSSKGQEKRSVQPAQKEDDSVLGAEPVLAPIVVPSLEGEADRPTLIVCPLSVLSTWKMQFEEHVFPGTLDVSVYYGPDRDRRRSAVAAHDVVLTTYNTLLSEVGFRDGLFGVNWLRIIADEAHYVKNAKTQTAKALEKISARFRWALTGTPIQNSLKDLHGILFYLHVEPLTDHSLFRRTIERPLIEGQPEGLPRLRALAGSLALRRTKHSSRQGIPLVTLPPKEVFIVEVELDTTARQKYERWETAGRALVSHMLAEGTLLLNYTSVIEVLLRLRQICCDPSLVMQDEPKFAQLHISQSPHAKHSDQRVLPLHVMRELVDLLRAGLEDECPICLSEMQTPCVTPCRHIFCRRCIELVIARDKALCPLCRGELSIQHLVDMPPEIQPEDTTGASAEWALGKKGKTTQGRPPSAKISVMLTRLNEAWATAPEEKHVVFSQFTSMLDLVEVALREQGVGCCRIDGRTPGPRREAFIRAFTSQDSSSPKVFLISLKAGGVGLNLTAANHVHLLEPWWSPAVEEQAADRIHRLGQRRPVRIHRYVVSQSIEERMLELQEEKRKLMAAAFGMRPTAEEVRATRLRDVRLLMDLNE